MRIKITRIILSAAFFLFSLLAYTQFSQHPPEPRMQGSQDPIPGKTQPCDREDGGIDFEPDPDTGSNPPPPPPGLCMPINDYIYPLLVLGVLVGAYAVQKMETKA